MTTGGWRAASLAAAAMAMGATAAAGQDFEWSQAMDDGEVLEVRGITGSILARQSRDGTARVFAEKDGRRSDFEDVEIRLVEQRTGYVVCAVYGPRYRGEDSCSNDGGRDDREGHNSIDVEVSFAVEVPEGVEFVGTMVTGDVEAEGLSSDVTATSVTGDVLVSTTGTVRANTVSGSLDIAMGRLERDQRFNTVSGDITLRLPTNLDADVRFESLSGDLESDFDLRIENEDRQWIGSDIRATIGAGGHRIALKTVSGDVKLRRSRSGVR